MIYAVAILLLPARQLSVTIAMTLVRMVQMAIHKIVDMIPVRDRYMATSFAVHMIVCDVLVVGCAGHRLSPSVRILTRELMARRNSNPAATVVPGGPLRLAAECGRLSTLCRSHTSARTSAAGHPVGVVGQRRGDHLVVGGQPSGRDRFQVWEACRCARFRSGGSCADILGRW